MAANQNQADDITSEEILAFVLGDADEKTARRVGAAALAFPAVRERVGRARTLALDLDAAAFLPSASEDADFAQRAARLRERMVETAVAMGAENAVPVSPPAVTDVVAALARLVRDRGGVLYQAGASAARDIANALGGAAATTSQSLLTGRHALTLPCLAPATATATASAAQVQRQTLTTGDGVRIEFQQLPGAAPPRLRVFVDASGLTGEAAERGYNVAYLTIEENDGMALVNTPSNGPGGASPDRHIFVVPLNNEGRGFTEVTVGGTMNVGGAALPSPRGACHLVGATLARWSPEFGGAAAFEETTGDDNGAPTPASSP